LRKVFPLVLSIVLLCCLWGCSGASPGKEKGGLYATFRRGVDLKLSASDFEGGLCPLQREYGVLEGIPIAWSFFSSSPPSLSEKAPLRLLDFVGGAKGLAVALTPLPLEQLSVFFWGKFGHAVRRSEKVTLALGEAYLCELVDSPKVFSEKLFGVVTLPRTDVVMGGMGEGVSFIALVLRGE